MAAPLRVTLTDEESSTLSELRIASSVPYRVRDRAHMLLLNGSGWSAPMIAEIMSCHEHTVRAAIKQWEEVGLYGLWEREGRGQKRIWDEVRHGLPRGTAERGRAHLQQHSVGS